MTLRKIDMVESLYAQLDIPKRDCARIVDCLIDIVTSELTEGNAVMVSGFGKWAVKAKKERSGRNPLNGEHLRIDARRVVTFKASATLKQLLNCEIK